MSETLADDTVRDRTIAIIADQALIEPSEVRSDATLEQLGLDSLGLVEIVFSIEEAFDVQVPFNANEPSQSDFDISTVDSIVRAVENLVAAKT